MTEGLGRAELELATNQAPLDKGLGEAKTKSLGFLGQVESSFKKLSGSTIGGALLQGVGLGAGLSAFGAINSAISGAISFMGDAVTAASNLQQSVGAVESVFGAAAGKILAYGRQAAESLGLSEQQIAQMSAEIGAQLIGMGFSADEAADRVINLEQRAADMAATFGGTTADAVQAIGSLMRGERDPIERYGVSLREADIQARILALGLDTSTTAAQKESQAIASLDLLMEQTTSTSGQFERESDSLAGTQQRLSANLANVTAEIGEKLLPILSEVMGFINDVGIPTIRFLVDALGVAGDVISNMTGGPLRDAAMAAVEQEKAVRALADQYGKSFDAIALKVAEAMQANGGNLEAATAAVENELAAQKAAHDQAIWEQAQAWEAAYPHLESIAVENAAIPRQAIEAEWDDMRASAYQTMVEHAKGLLDAQNVTEVAFDALLQVQEEAMTEAQEAAYLSGVLQDQRLIDGMNSPIDAIRAQAHVVYNAATDRLRDLAAEGGAAGAGLMDALSTAIGTRQWKVEDSINNVTRSIRGFFPGSEPKDPRSGLRGITDAFGIDEVLAGGVLRHQGVLERAMQSLTRPLPFTASLDLAASGMRPGLAGAYAGGAGTSGGRQLASMVGEQTFNINGAEPGEVERQVSRALRQAALRWEFGG